MVYTVITMLGIQIDQELKSLMNSPARKIDFDTLQKVCKIRKGEKGCRYIMFGPQGYVCMKHTKIKKAIDSLCSQEKMTAKGDNCDGLGEDPNGVSEEEYSEKIKEQEKTSA